MDHANFRDLKVVLLHDWLTGFRGGERVLEALCELFPSAPLYTLIYEKGKSSPTIENRKIVASPLNRLPGISRHYRKFLPFFPLIIDSMMIDEEPDLIISSSHCVIKGIRKKGKAKHLSYIHSPMRYIYDQFEVYFGKESGSPFWQRGAAKLVRPYLQAWDKFSNDNVDQLVANSLFIQERMRKYYQRESIVIHPFVDLNDFREIQRNPPSKENYFLMVTAFAPNKRVDLAIEAFNQTGHFLKIVGSGQLDQELRSMAKPHIEFLGNRSRSEIISLMAKARAFIFPGIEDFGITPLESLAAGTPVLAFDRGGVLETLNEKVAVFFNESTPDSLNKGLEKLLGKSFSQRELFQRAEQFSKEIFKQKIIQVVNQVVNQAVKETMDVPNSDH